jgi:hypothetical protein
MRGTRAKAIRALALSRLPDKVLDYPTYREVPRSRREKSFLTGRFANNAEGKWEEIVVKFFTWTIALSPGCRRFYTQRLKRHLVRSHA